MSRSSTANFADFFPSAPRAAKNKAKERQRAKSKSLEAPKTSAAAEPVAGTSASREHPVAGHSEHSNGAASDATPAHIDDNESVQGDLLNGVGSASSHASTVSSVFSLPAQNSIAPTSAAPQSQSNLTPLTNTDSSPPDHPASPRVAKLLASSLPSSESKTNPEASHNSTNINGTSSTESGPQAMRVIMRDPERGVKGKKCVYDPALDKNITSSERKKKKPIYKEFGLVRNTCISVGSVIFLEDEIR